MLEAVLGIAEMLYLPTVAEGVETAEQMNALRSMGCDVIQGYYFSKPVPPEDYEKFIEERLSTAEDIASAELSHHRPRLSYEDYSYDELHDNLTGLAPSQRELSAARLTEGVRHPISRLTPSKNAHSRTEPCSVREWAWY